MRGNVEVRVRRVWEAWLFTVYRLLPFVLLAALHIDADPCPAMDVLWPHALTLSLCPNPP